MRPLLFLALSSLAFAVDAKHDPEWVKSVVASAHSAYAPWFTNAPKPTAKRQVRPDHVGGLHDGPAGVFPDSPQASLSNGPPTGMGRPPWSGAHPNFPFRAPQNASTTNGTCSFWLEDIQHQGTAPYAADGYQVFRNVRDYGAVGDGVTDDTAAINLAISSGGRCGPRTCSSSTTTPALVYFPAGNYLVSSSIINYYDTQIIGNPNCLPVIQAASNLTGWLIDSSGFGSTNTFFRQIRNLVLDLTAVPASVPVTGIFWPTAQATRLQNIVFKMSEANGTQHQGVFISEGSAGIVNDLVAYGGFYAFNWGNQQATISNLTIYNAVTAINQIWNWGFSYSQLSINNCSVGMSMSSGAPNALSVGSNLIFDSVFTDTPIGIAYGRSNSSQPLAANSLVIENVQFNNVPSIVQGPSRTVLAGSSGGIFVDGWAAGHAYTPNGPNVVEGPITPNHRPSALLVDGKYLRKAKPEFSFFPTSEFISVRSVGAKGDGTTDDTAAFQAAINKATAQNKILFIDSGVYVLSTTIYIPAGARMTGEAYPTLLAAGDFFSNMSNPQPFIQIGKAGETGTVEWTDTMISGRGALAGAIFIEYNLVSPSPSPSPSPSTHPSTKPPSTPDQRNDNIPFPARPTGPSFLWDVHVRIGGFAGSNLLINDCPVDRIDAIPPNPVPSQCIAGFMSMHITSSASNLVLDGNWLWTADHDIEDPTLRQITIFNGRGLYVDSNAGPLWLWGTAVEHHTLYEYQLAGAKDIFMGEIQTETAYYQPNPPATLPFPALAGWNDPVFPDECYTRPGFNYTGPTTNFTNPCNGFGLRVLDASRDVLVYGAGLYSFFANNAVGCTPDGTSPECQDRIFSVEGASEVSVYCLNTVGVQSMADVEGQGSVVVAAVDNVAGFTNTVVLFRTIGQEGTAASLNETQVADRQLQGLAPTRFRSRPKS